MRYTVNNSIYRYRHRKLLAFAMLGIITVLIMGLGIKLFSKKPLKMAVNSNMSPSISAEKYQTVEGRYLFSGTVMLGRAINTFAGGNYEQPFSAMNTLGRYDDNIGVLECPITSNNVSYQTQVNKLIFNCSPNWLPTLLEHFPILSLSSNHLNDMGPAGYQETVNRLSKAGFQTVGNYNPHAEKDDCKVVVLSVHLKKPNGQLDKNSLPLAFCSYNYKSLFKPEPGELESIQRWARIMPVIALMNGGPEYQHHAGIDQENVAHKMIDYGADFVVGNGTHWVQNTEVYKGKLIVYSMGNFIFDQLDYDGRIALNLSVDMSIAYNQNVGKWISLSSVCKSSSVKCFEAAQSQHLSKLEPKYSFDVVGSYGGFQKVCSRATTQQQEDIEQRANWASSLMQLSN